MSKNKIEHDNVVFSVRRHVVEACRRDRLSVHPQRTTKFSRATTNLKLNLEIAGAT